MSCLWGPEQDPRPKLCGTSVASVHTQRSTEAAWCCTSECTWASTLSVSPLQPRVRAPLALGALHSHTHRRATLRLLAVPGCIFATQQRQGSLALAPLARHQQLISRRQQY
ncbi:hypothetical protein HPB51_021950 [Rhipicephalus microplus]|uniref:Uncharacterized protein n=1 Tax=Rhipicephalus microplus TaxID=6941 RepID=A0A9J6EJF6_RHIMP|nr:hypothetical protein HPB51_021950 [Rhipicephalus microplus]